MALWRSDPRRRTRAAALALGLAALAVLGIAGFRLSGSGPDDVLDTLHAAAVLAYQVAWVVAVLAWHRGATGWAVAGVSTLLLVLALSGGGAAEALGGPGLVQRAWVVVDQAWLLLAVLSARRAAITRR